MTTGGRAWLGLSALLIGGSVLAVWLPAAWFDWQPELAASQPWRAWTSVFVHWSALHLGANLLAATVVGAFGWAAQMPREQAWAWFAAWPLTQLPLLLRPDLAHYGGLSGMLHGGVAIVCLWLLLRARGARRAVGGLVLLGLIIKLVSERPWGDVLQHSDEWDIAVVPLAHSTGALAGLVCGAAALGLQRRSRSA